MKMKRNIRKEEEEITTYLNYRESSIIDFQAEFVYPVMNSDIFD